MICSKSIVAGTISSAFLAGQVAANGTFKGLEINGKLVEAYNPSMPSQNPAPAVIGWEFRRDPNSSFVSAKNLRNPDIICNKGATNAQTSVTVKAGKEVVGIWLDWPKSHKGPIITYLAHCNGSCTKADKERLKFFKIHEEGLLDGKKVPGFWATDALIRNRGRITIPIPAKVAPGEYVMRHEIIALHKTNHNYKDGAAQLYPQCVNLIIKGSGITRPRGQLGVWLYDIRSPGLNFNINQLAHEYLIPGPYMPFRSSGDNSRQTNTLGNEENRVETSSRGGYDHWHWMVNDIPGPYMPFHSSGDNSRQTNTLGNEENRVETSSREGYDHWHWMVNEEHDEKASEESDYWQSQRYLLGNEIDEASSQ